MIFLGMYLSPCAARRRCPCALADACDRQGAGTGRNAHARGARTCSSRWRHWVHARLPQPAQPPWVDAQLQQLQNG